MKFNNWGFYLELFVIGLSGFVVGALCGFGIIGIWYHWDL